MWRATGCARDDGREFSLLGAGTELYSGAALLLIAAVLALAFRQRTLALAIPVIVMAAVPIVQARELPDSSVGGRRARA